MTATAVTEAASVDPRFTGVGDAMQTTLARLLRKTGRFDVVTDAGWVAEAEDAMRVVDRAIVELTSFRGDMGAFQKNTLESSIQFLQQAHEEISNAESVIRDADMAEEMSTFTRNQILVNSSTAMLAQANQTPLSVMTLLQS